MKRVANDLFFVGSNEDLMKEAMVILKKTDVQFQKSVLVMVEGLS